MAEQHRPGPESSDGATFTNPLDAASETPIGDRVELELKSAHETTPIGDSVERDLGPVKPDLADDAVFKAEFEADAKPSPTSETAAAARTETARAALAEAQAPEMPQLQPEAGTPRPAGSKAGRGAHEPRGASRLAAAARSRFQREEAEGKHEAGGRHEAVAEAHEATTEPMPETATPTAAAEAVAPQPEPSVETTSTADPATTEVHTGHTPFKVDSHGVAEPITEADLEQARAEQPAVDRLAYDQKLAETMAYNEKPLRESPLRPLPRAAEVDTSIRADEPREAQYETNINRAMEEAFRADRGAAEMNALAAEYRMQYEILMGEQNTSLTRGVQGAPEGGAGVNREGQMKLLEESYKAAMQAVRERYAKHDKAVTAKVGKLVEARAKHEDFEVSIVSGKSGDPTGEAWVLRHELGIPDGAKPLSRYGGERGYGGLFHLNNRGARMVQRVYAIPTGGYLVECVRASTGEFVRSTVINSGREPMRFGYFRAPFTGTEIEAKLKSLRQADLRRERPKNIGDYFGLRFGPKFPGRSGRFSYDISGTAAWDSQLGGPLYNQRRRVPWYLQLFTAAQRR